MKAHWLKAEAAWAALTRREQVLLMITACVIPLILVFVYSVEPALKRYNGIDSEIAGLSLAVEADERLLQLLQRADIPDPNIKARAELTQLQARLENIDNSLSRFAQRLVQPDEMLDLLRSVLVSGQGLTIVSANSLDAEPVILSATSLKVLSDGSRAERAQAAREAVIFLHPFEVQLRGSYGALFNYLQSLESQHEGFFWDVLAFEADRYPEASIKIRVHTLSTEEDWLRAP